MSCNAVCNLLSLLTRVLYCVFAACPPGMFGRNCKHQCQCKNSAECDPISGECICAPGWRGGGCDESRSTMAAFYSYWPECQPADAVFQNVRVSATGRGVSWLTLCMFQSVGAAAKGRGVSRLMVCFRVSERQLRAGVSAG